MHSPLTVLVFLLHTVHSSLTVSSAVFIVDIFPLSIKRHSRPSEVQNLWSSYPYYVEKHLLVNVGLCVCVRACVRMCVCMHTCMVYVHVSKCVCVCVCLCTMYMHRYTCTCTCVRLSLLSMTLHWLHYYLTMESQCMRAYNVQAPVNEVTPHYSWGFIAPFMTMLNMLYCSIYVILCIWHNTYVMHSTCCTYAMLVLYMFCQAML